MKNLEETKEELEHIAATHGISVEKLCISIINVYTEEAVLVNAAYALLTDLTTKSYNEQ